MPSVYKATNLRMIPALPAYLVPNYHQFKQYIMQSLNADQQFGDHDQFVLIFICLLCRLTISYRALNEEMITTPPRGSPIESTEESPNSSMSGLSSASACKFHLQVLDLQLI
jgi:hypothetical protein